LINIEPGLPDFSRYNVPKLERYTKLSQNVPKGHKIYYLAVKKTEGPYKFQHLQLQDLQKFTQIVIFGLKIYVPSCYTALNYVANYFIVALFFNAFS
jgi:hypothetical protein